MYLCWSITKVFAVPNRDRDVGLAIVILEHDSINNKKWNKIQIEMLQNVQHITRLPGNNHRNISLI